MHELENGSEEFVDGLVDKMELKDSSEEVIGVDDELKHDGELNDIEEVEVDNKFDDKESVKDEWVINSDDDVDDDVEELDSDEQELGVGVDEELITNGVDEELDIDDGDEELDVDDLDSGLSIVLECSSGTNVDCRAKSNDRL